VLLPHNPNAAALKRAAAIVLVTTDLGQTIIAIKRTILQTTLRLLTTVIMRQVPLRPRADARIGETVTGCKTIYLQVLQGDADKRKNREGIIMTTIMMVSSIAWIKGPLNRPGEVTMLRIIPPAMISAFTTQTKTRSTNIINIEMLEATGEPQHLVKLLPHQQIRSW
jgi:hypothetical protein